MKTKCECEIGGWCDRHQMEKTDHLAYLCRSDERYFKQWENGYGPGQETPPPHDPKLRIKDGPGTELKKILAKLHMHQYSGCACRLRIAQMNAWGVDQCRERIDEIAAWLEEAATKYNWLTKLMVSLPGIKGGSRAVLKKLITEAINNAEKREEVARIRNDSTT